MSGPTDAACHDCCAPWTESGGRAHAVTCAVVDAGLGVGHIWTNMRCPAYRTLNGGDCSCA